MASSKQQRQEIFIECFLHVEDPAERCTCATDRGA